jgi:hypothetical protein
MPGRMKRKIVKLSNSAQNSHLPDDDGVKQQPSPITVFPAVTGPPRSCVQTFLKSALRRNVEVVMLVWSDQRRAFDKSSMTRREVYWVLITPSNYPQYVW